jgi:rod shape determining protein RodA
LICTGIAAWFFFQIAVNIGMNLQLVPVTGLPLPFISYGGSSLVPMLAAMGFVQSVLLRHRKIEF